MRALWEYLQQDSELIAAMEKVVTADQATQLDADQAFKLHSLGLIQWQDNKVEPRCKLYRLYFREQLRGIQALSA
ncbi:MAG: AAA-like domain-containing protein [Coleofasciculaceae cyanobacterium]